MLCSCLVLLCDVVLLVVFDNQPGAYWNRIDDALYGSMACTVVGLYEPLYFLPALSAVYGVVKVVSAWGTTGAYCLLVLSVFSLFPLVPSKKKKKEEEDYELLEEGEEEKKGLGWSGIAWLLRPYFWPSSWTGRFAVASTIALVLLSKLASIAAPLFLGTAASAAGKGRARKAAIYGSAYAGCSLMSKVLKEGQSLAYLRVQRVAFAELARETFSHLHRLSLEWYLSKKTGEVVRVVDRGTSGADTMMKYGVLYLGPSVAEAIAVCAIFVLKFHLWQLSALVTFSVVLYTIATVVMTLWRAKFRASMNVSDNKWHTKLTDSLTNFETVKYFTAEGFEARRFGETVQRYQTSSVSVQASLSLLNIVQQVILNACLAGSLAIAATKADVGTFVSVSGYVAQLFAPLSFLGTVYNMLVTAIVDLKNLSQLLAQPPLVADSPQAFPHPKALLRASRDADSSTTHGLGVAFKDVRFKYPNRRAAFALSRVSFEVAPGASLGICGPTGSGKSTCARLLFRFFDVDSGCVLVDGIDVRSCTQQSLRTLLGVVPQDTVLFNDTIGYNIAYGHEDFRGRRTTAKPSEDDEVVKAAKRAELWPLIETLEDGLDTVVGERGLQLSGGEKQRVAVARLLLKNPPVAVFDEATSALDTATEQAIQASLNQLAQTRTTITIAHRLGSLKECEQILVMRQGQPVEIGTHTQLLSNPDSLYSSMWDAQLSHHRK